MIILYPGAYDTYLRKIHDNNNIKAQRGEVKVYYSKVLKVYL